MLDRAGYAGHTWPVIVLLHGLHTAVIVLGTVAVGGVLMRAGRDERAAEALRRAGPDGLIVLAQERARQHTARSVAGRLPVAASVLTTVAGAVHAGVSPEHFHEGWRFGVFFLVLSIGQFGLAYVIARRPDAPVLVALAVVNGGTVLLWAATRVITLPLVLDTTEPIGLWDSVSTAAEVIACAAALRAALRLRSAPVSGSSVRVGAG